MESDHSVVEIKVIKEATVPFGTWVVSLIPTADFQQFEVGSPLGDLPMNLICSLVEGGFLELRTREKEWTHPTSSHARTSAIH